MSQSSGEICVNPYHYERLSHSNHGRMQYFRDDGSDNEQQPEKLILVLDDNEPDDNDEKWPIEITLLLYSRPFFGNHMSLVQTSLNLTFKALIL